VLRRVVHPRQQGTRLAFSDSIFDRVAAVEEQLRAPPIPVPEVSETGFDDFIAAENELELRAELRDRRPA
jgi:hypothetical protein